MKGNKLKSAIIKELKEMPIIQFACKKASVSRPSYYRWRNEDTEFAKEADAAIVEGESLITDMSESQLISLIRDRNFQALQLWLRHHHPKYGQKVEITANFQSTQDELTPEQEAVVREALRLASLLPEERPKENNQLNNKGYDKIKLPATSEKIQLQPPTTGSDREDDKRP